MSLIEGDSIYNLFQNQDLGLDFASSIVPDSPNKFKKNNNSNNNNNNNVFNFQQMQTKQHQSNNNNSNNNNNNNSNNLIYNGNSNNNNNNNLQHNSAVFMNNNNTNNNNNTHNNHNNHQEEQLFSIYLQPEKENEINNNNHHHEHNVNNNNNNTINLINPNGHHLQHQHNNNNQQQQQQQFYQIKNPIDDIYSSSGIVPTQEQNKKIDYINEPVKQQQQQQQHQQQHQQQQQNYNIVPESIFDVPFGIPNQQSMLNVQNNNNKMNFKQPIQPNQLIPIPPSNNQNNNINLTGNSNNNNNNNNNSISNQMSNLNNNINNQLNGANHPTSNGKKKEEDKTIKKRKFISSTPVKGENGTTLIPTTDGGYNMDEERHQKRQRRLVKNREAAQLFRQRQKAYIQDLEKKVSDLTGTNSEFRARVELLNSENKLIREQLLYLRNFVTQAVSFSFPKGAPGSGNGSNSPSGVADQFLNSILPPGLNSPLPQGILPAGMNLQNPMIMSAIAEAASKNSTFRQNIQGNLLGTPIPSPQSSLTSNSGNNSPNKQQQLNPSSPNNNSNNNNNNNNNSINISPASSSSHQVPYLPQNTPPQQSTPNQR